MKYYAHLYYIRDSFNPILRAGKLIQWFALDAYVKIEQNRLNYQRAHQVNLRSDSYRITWPVKIAEDHQGTVLSWRLSHIGSPRAIQQSYQEAMAIVARYGKPTRIILGELEAYVYYVHVIEFQERGLLHWLALDNALDNERRKESADSGRSG
ncbi:hypothetical protein NECAME_05256 [Necator americanus]|uniref:Helitron helicase-like domain-containing protein n=1 Tax=Necator americanus TaxID=51031 RepID=W2SKM3_NECAM|nr:hypothetical protein NECAME_05256 [Necator americanus]ETN69401.1 hypothetical protein NECAME_05256 [Necator americanus]